MSLDEEKARIRQIGYRVAAVASVAGPLLAVALTEGGVSNWVALAVATISALFAGTGAAVAARQTRRQINEGRFADPASTDPVEVVVSGLQAITAAAQAAEAAKATVTQAAADTLAQWGGSAASTVEQAIAEITGASAPPP